MRHCLLPLIAALAACSETPAPTPSNEQQTVEPIATSAKWQLAAKRLSLRFADASQQLLSLSCDGGTLTVHADGFTPVGSEERLSFGQGGEVVALVVDPRGNAERGGVSGTGPVPADLARLLDGEVSASYGAQRVGPLPVPPATLANSFVAACRAAPKAVPAAAKASPCWEQDGKAIRATPLRAIGTEPFWGAKVEGRCVTYSTPDDQAGTRVWTRLTAAPDGSIYEGSLAGRRFRLAIRSAANCSDGMSDERYPMSAELIVSGETRRGCARPAP